MLLLLYSIQGSEYASRYRYQALQFTHQVLQLSGQLLPNFSSGGYSGAIEHGCCGANDLG